MFANMLSPDLNHCFMCSTLADMQTLYL